MVQRQIDTFFKKRTFTTPMKLTLLSSASPQDKATTTNSAITNELSEGKINNPLECANRNNNVANNNNMGSIKPSIQRSLFADTSPPSQQPTAPLLHKRKFSQISKSASQCSPTVSPERSIKKYFKIDGIRQSRANKDASASADTFSAAAAQQCYSQSYLSTQQSYAYSVPPRRYEDSSTFFNLSHQRRLIVNGDDSRHILVASIRNSSHNSNNNNNYNNMSDPWSSACLSVDVLMNVFCFLSVREIVHVISATSRSWRMIAQKVLKNYHCYLHEFQLSRLSVAEYEYLASKSELTHVKYITKLFKQYTPQRIFDSFFLSCKLSPDYNQSKPDKMFEEIIVQCKDRVKLKVVNVKPLKFMLEHSKNSIKVLCLRYLHLSSQVASYIPNLRELEQLYLTNNYDINDSVVQSICSRCKHLKILQLSNCMNISDASVECISSISQLTALDLSFNSGITFTNIHKLRRNKYLKSLSLRATSIKCSQLETLLVNIPTIRKLNIDGTTRKHQTSIFNFLLAIQQIECRQLNFLAAKILVQFIPKSLRSISIDKNNCFSEPCNNNHLTNQLTHDLNIITFSLNKITLEIYEIVEKSETITQLKTTSNCLSARVQERLAMNRLTSIFNNIHKATNRTQSIAFQEIIHSTTIANNSSIMLNWAALSFDQ